jgi:predicted DNA-binding transcriptional regulator AlpA
MLHMRHGELIPKREVLRRAGLSDATLIALVRAGAFPGPVLGDRWESRSVEAWGGDLMRRGDADGG